MGAAEKQDGEQFKTRPTSARSKVLPVLRTPEEVANWLGISRKALYNMLDRGQIPASAVFRIGGRRLRFDEHRLKDWIAEQRAAPSKE